uniref:Beta-defensin-like domain-containing protein n=2 Tax=Passerellidae TaxID=1729112 RepID=A0A8D2LZN0_ZONAL
MKILFLLFPLILLLVQGAAGDIITCRRKGGSCSFLPCRYPTRAVGRCSSVQVCCIR